MDLVHASLNTPRVGLLLPRLIQYLDFPHVGDTQADPSALS